MTYSIDHYDPLIFRIMQESGFFHMEGSISHFKTEDGFLTIYEKNKHEGKIRISLNTDFPDWFDCEIFCDSSHVVNSIETALKHLRTLGLIKPDKGDGL